VHVIVVADGDAPARAALDDAWPGWADHAGLVIAADGGATACPALGLVPDLVVGDGDSLGPDEQERLERSGILFEAAPVDKDESDLELALAAAVRRGADRITILGAFGGGRLDHELANVALLAHPVIAGVGVVLLDERSRVALLRAPGADGEPARRALPGPIGGRVSLLPVGAGVEGATTTGLRYPLDDEPLPYGPARGLSNVRVADDAAVWLRQGLLLIVEAPATLGA
jgi:thiamine pyrophosphokinase